MDKNRQINMSTDISLGNHIMPICMHMVTSAAAGVMSAEGLAHVETKLSNRMPQ